MKIGCLQILCLIVISAGGSEFGWIRFDGKGAQATASAAQWVPEITGKASFHKITRGELEGSSIKLAPGKFSTSQRQMIFEDGGDGTVFWALAPGSLKIQDQPLFILTFNFNRNSQAVVYTSGERLIFQFRHENKIEHRSVPIYSWRNTFNFWHQIAVI